MSRMVSTMNASRSCQSPAVVSSAAAASFMSERREVWKSLHIEAGDLARSTRRGRGLHRPAKSPFHVRRALAEISQDLAGWTRKQSRREVFPHLFPESSHPLRLIVIGSRQRA